MTDKLTNTTCVHCGYLWGHCWTCPTRQTLVGNEAEHELHPAGTRDDLKALRKRVDDTPYTTEALREWYDNLISTDEETAHYAKEAWDSHDYEPLKWALDKIADLEAVAEVDRRTIHALHMEIALWRNKRNEWKVIADQSARALTEAEAERDTLRAENKELGIALRDWRAIAEGYGLTLEQSEVDKTALRRKRDSIARSADKVVKQAIAERDNWKETARFHLRNEEYYHGTRDELRTASARLHAALSIVTPALETVMGMLPGDATDPFVRTLGYCQMLLEESGAPDDPTRDTNGLTVLSSPIPPSETD